MKAKKYHRKQRRVASRVRKAISGAKTPKEKKNKKWSSKDDSGSE